MQQGLQYLPPDDPGTGGGSGTPTPYPNVQAYWFTYDADNRVQISNGALASGHIALTQAASSYELHYDDAGNAITRITVNEYGHTLVQSSYYDERNELVRADYSKDTTAGGSSRGIEELRRYDDAGHLRATESFYEIGHHLHANGGLIKLNPDAEDPIGDGADVGGMLATATIDNYDPDGRLLQEQNFGHASGWQGDGASATIPSTLPGTDATSWASLDLRNQVTYKDADGSSGYDAMGNVTAYRYKDVTSGRTDTYHVSYKKKDSYLESVTNGTSTNPDYSVAADFSYYNVLGERLAIDQRFEPPGGTLQHAIRAFAYDANGQILRRRDGSEAADHTFAATGGAGTTHYVYVNGQQMGSVDEAGGIHVLDGLTAFSNTQSGGSGYIVQEGDTLKSIAQAQYGNASLWYVVAQANGLASDDDLAAGQSLSIPQVTTNSNDASTFKPYSPAEIAGSTTPPSVYAPAPPSHHCSAAAMILIIAVVVIATIATAGAFAVAAGASGGIFGAGASALVAGTVGEIGVASTLGAAFMGGMAGSVAGQFAGQAMGQHGGFDLAEAFAGGLKSAATAGFAAGLGQLGGDYSLIADANGGLQPAGAGMLAASGYAAGTEIGQLDGHTGTVTWQGMVASAVSAGLTSAVGLPTNNQLASGAGTGGFLGDFEAGIVNGALLSGVNRALGQHGASGAEIAEDAFGNALANSVIGYEVRWEQGREQLQSTEAALLRNEQARANADIDVQMQGAAAGDMDAFRLQAQDRIDAQLDQVDARLQADLDQRVYQNLGSGAWARSEPVARQGQPIHLGTFYVDGQPRPDYWYQAAKPATESEYSLASLADRFAQGLGGGIVDNFRPLGTLLGEEAGRFATGNFAETLPARALAFFDREEGLFLSGHAEDSTTYQFAKAVGGTVEGIVTDPKGALVGGYDYAVGKGTDWMEEVATWWGNHTPAERAYGLGHFTGEQAGGVLMGEGGKIVLGGVGVLRGAEFVQDVPDSGVPRAVIGRMDDLRASGVLRPDEYTIADKLPNLGSPKANYYQNMSVLREEMGRGVPIRDASSFRPDTELAPTPLWPERTIRQTFTGAERNQLRNSGWTFDGEYWNPPKR